MLRIGLVVALIVLGAVAGTTLSFAPAFLAIPLALILVVFLLVTRRRESSTAADPERNRLGARRQRFSERDRRTLTP